jgi:hypothetical protein
MLLATLIGLMGGVGAVLLSRQPDAERDPDGPSGSPI